MENLSENSRLSLMGDSKSLVNKRKRRGPRMDPCGTAEDPVS